MHDAALQLSNMHGEYELKQPCFPLTWGMYSLATMLHDKYAASGLVTWGYAALKLRYMGNMQP
jgi:hypothetical protein